ncbi:RNA-directed DNA polymerase from mobile element jockey [Eumeta japonica]|uniref:RNA-directed DNA polymerase from mobile element jockey n=1 Tax=Eumeta variegata TaxID=151549 RepID=A0A4C1Z8Q4_EUMVA|nr:RNA-directed DNA polymerase from mobile element jockey [Eumeta japonica]
MTHAASPRSEAFHLRLEVQARARNERQRGTTGLRVRQRSTSVHSSVIPTIVSYLEGRSFFVAVEDATSDPQPIHAGVPQGNCLSPCLYGVYTDDIPTRRSTTGLGGGRRTRAIR